MNWFNWILYAGFCIAISIQTVNAQSDADSTLIPLNGGRYMVKKTSISNSKFIDISMTGTTFNDVNLSNAVFHNVNMNDIEVTAAQLSGAKFKHLGLPPGSKQTIRPVLFEEGDLRGLTISRCDLSNATIENCAVENMKINGVLVTEMLQAYREKQNSIKEK